MLQTRVRVLALFSCFYFELLMEMFCNILCFTEWKHSCRQKRCMSSVSLSSVSMNEIGVFLFDITYSFVYICVCAVSEPTLKWKIKKLISTRPNPLQRKISAPPAVKHRTETLGRVSLFCSETHKLMFVFYFLCIFLMGAKCFFDLLFQSLTFFKTTLKRYFYPNT